MKYTFNYIEIQQPIGTFYLCCIPALILLKIVDTVQRSKDKNGVQREMSTKRINEIGLYCSEPDAIFPTPIVISVNNDAEVSINNSDHKIIIPVDEGIIGDVIDGQHRLWGIERSSYAGQFNLPVVLMFGLTVEEKAYVFSTINSNQTKVDPSLIYDLFEVSKLRSPFKTVHEVARVMNSNIESPFYNRLKMLGRKEPSQDNATLSQGTFARSVLMLISNNPEEDVRNIKLNVPLKSNLTLPFREYFIHGNDEVITRILMNCFQALKSVFNAEWSNPKNNILWKTTGFRGVIYSMLSLCRSGFRKQNLTRAFFEDCFESFKVTLQRRKISLTSDSFPGGGEQNQKRIARLIVDSVANLNIDDYYTHLDKARDIDSFINGLIDVNRYDLFDIAEALDNGKTTYGTIIVKEKGDSVELINPIAETSLLVPYDKRNECLNYLEDKYMHGLDAESWLGYQDAIEKED